MTKRKCYRWNWKEYKCDQASGHDDDKIDDDAKGFIWLDTAKMTLKNDTEYNTKMGRKTNTWKKNYDDKKQIE